MTNFVKGHLSERAGAGFAVLIILFFSLARSGLWRKLSDWTTGFPSGASASRHENPVLKPFPLLENVGISSTKPATPASLAEVILLGSLGTDHLTQTVVRTRSFPVDTEETTREDSFNQIADGGAHQVRGQHTSDQFKPEL